MQLTGLFVYPIKACAGIALQESMVVERGLAFDRRYVLVDKTGLFLTQRELPQLCLVQTAFHGERLLVSTAKKPTLELPKELATDGALASRVREWRVWDDVGTALELSEGSRWFSELLDTDVSLLYMPDSERRAVNPKRARPGDVVSFADAYPLLLISEASLSDLNQRLPTGTAPLEMRRFRPNLVISGCAPYAEDDFRSFHIGGLALRGVKRCERCVVTTVNPDTAELGKEPLRTLSHYRKDDDLAPDGVRSEKVWFGMNLIHEGSGTLRLGDAVLA